MNNRPRPSAPRTLSAPPLAPLRAPQPTQYVGRFPALATLLAAGAVAPGCHDPECGSTRADELEAHGARVMPAARGGRAGEALREIGVALGVTAHTTAPTRAMAPGQLPAVTTTQQAPPPVQVVPNMDVDGGVGEVSPLPAVAPQAPPDPATTTTVPAAPRDMRPRMAPGRMRRVTPSPRGG